MPTIAGIHHVTAIASDPQRNLDFYTRVLGLRLVKVTVNFDDPSSYHFYFGDQDGSPGTILTFFPWPLAKRGKVGSGFVNVTAFRVPKGSIGFWTQRLAAHKVVTGAAIERFGQQVLPLEDPDGMLVELVEDAGSTASRSAVTPDIPGEHAISGFHSVALCSRDPAATIALLTGEMGFRQVGSDATRLRFAGAEEGVGQFVDVLSTPAPAGKLGAGIVHHVAFRARDDSEQAYWQNALAEAGQHVTSVQERKYFRSIYFREPGQILFEIATDAPGFAIDEAKDRLGTSLKLPPVYEPKRALIEAQLPKITLAGVKS